MLKSGASNSQAPTCNGLNVRDRHKRRHEDKRTPSLFSSPLLSPFGHKRWVSTRGKCSNSPISLLERAPLLPTLLLCLSALAVLISFLILPSLFDLRRRGGEDAVLPSSPLAELTIFLPASPLCRAFTEHTSLKVIYSQLSSRCSRGSAWQKELNLQDSIYFFFHNDLKQ